VDLDLPSGDAAVMLQLSPERTIHDAIQSFDRLDAEMLGAFLATHESGVRVLLAPLEADQAEAVTGARVGRLLDLLGGMADYVVVDTPACFGDAMSAALERSDEIYAVATMDVPSLKGVRVGLQALGRHGIDRGRVRLVLNRADSKVGLTPADVEASTGCPIVGRIPSDRLVPRSVNKGVPVVRDAPRSPVSRSMVELSQLVATRTEGVSSDVA
jgi:pilus assembly protein CpaE